MSDDEYAAIEIRIEHNIVLLAIVGVAIAAPVWGLRTAGGLAAGATLCWINTRWLRDGAAAVIQLGLAQAGAATVRVPRRTYAKFFGRIVLLLAVLYAILTWLRLPPIAVVCGLGAVLPAIVLEIAYELIRGDHRWSAR